MHNHHGIICTVKVLESISCLGLGGSDTAWEYTINADFAGEAAKVEQLVMGFQNAEGKYKGSLGGSSTV